MKKLFLIIGLAWVALAITTITEAADIDAQVDDALGASAFVVKNSSAVQQVRMDSYGRVGGYTAGEVNPRWQLNKDTGGANLAGIGFGPGGATAIDTNIWRKGAYELRTNAYLLLKDTNDGSLELGGGSDYNLGGYLKLVGNTKGGATTSVEVFLQPTKSFDVMEFTGWVRSLRAWGGGGVRVGNTNTDPGWNNLTVDGNTIVGGNLDVTGNTTVTGYIQQIGGGANTSYLGNTVMNYSLDTNLNITSRGGTSGDLILTAAGTGDVKVTTDADTDFNVGTGKLLVQGSNGYVGISAASPPGALLDVGAAGTLGVIRLAGSTSGNVTIQPAATAGTWTLTLPVDDGTVDQVLKTNGAGITSWTTAGGGGTPGGSDTQLQYNNGGAFGGIPELTYDDTAGKLFIQISDKLVICNTFTSAGINAAITALGITGGEVYLPEGTYTISAAVTMLYNNTTLRGAGKGTILQKSAAVYGINLNGMDYITVKDLQIDGASYAGFGIYGLGSTNCILENLYIRSNTYSGIKMDTDSNYFKISNCEITGNSEYGVMLVGTTYGVIANSNISSNTLSGIFVYPATTQYNTISGNIIQGNTQSGIYIQDSYNTISGNVIKGNSPNSDFDNVYLNAATYNTITGNEICNAGGAAVNADGIEINSTSAYNTITGNVIKDNGADAGWNCAIAVEGGDSNVIVGNILKGTGTTGKSIELVTGSDNNQIGGNRLVGTAVNSGTTNGFTVTGTLYYNP